MDGKPVDSKKILHTLATTQRDVTFDVGCDSGTPVDDKDDQEKFVPNGFMTLDFSGPTLVERVLLSNGTELYTNTIG